MPRPPTRPPAAALLTRRTALLGGLGLGTAAVAGCSFDGMSVQVPGSAPDSPSPSGAAASPAARDGDTRADEALVVRLDTRLTSVLALLTRTTARHPALRVRLRPLTAALSADLDTLRRAERSSASPSPTASATPSAAVPGSQQAALDAVVVAVRRLRATLREDSLSALSGRFARLVAAMAAALSQRLRALAPTPLATSVPALTGTSSSDTGQTSPLQDALAGEHAAVYVYAVLGAQTSASSAPDAYDRLSAAYVWHRDCRDRLVAVLRARGLQPVAASPSYALPNAVGSPAQVTAAALVTEQRVTGVYGRLVQETVAGDRSWAVALLEQSAERQLLFGGRAPTFPGLS